MRHRMIGIAGLLMAASLAAAPPAAAAAPAAACHVGRIAELPVTMSGLRPFVPAAIDGHEALFLADSGAFYSVISPGNAATFGLKTHSTTAHMRGIGGEAGIALATVKAFTLAGHALPDVQFIVGGSEVGGGAGLLGQNILGLGDVEYDLAGGAIRLFRPHDCGAAVMAYWAGAKPYSVVPLDMTTMADKHTIGSAYLNGVKLRVIFDTGAPISLLTLKAAARAGVRPGGAGVQPTGQSGGLGRHLVATWIGPFASFKIGDEEIRQIRLRFGDTEMEGADMLIGADFFLSHRVYVANGQRKLYFTYNGGPVFSLAGGAAARFPAAGAAPAADDRAAPTDADGFARRGAALASRHELEPAIADLTRAIALAPKEPRYPYRRAMMRLSAHRPVLAMADLDLTLKLKPDDTDALFARAMLKLDANRRQEARADLDAAARVLPDAADMRLQLGEIYGRLDAFGPAIAQFDLWIASHKEDRRQPVALNARCWTRAQWGRDLDRALADCNAALRLEPKMPNALDSRGLVQLRRGEPDRAIADYDAALAAKPGMAWSLYGRGVARLRKGQTPAGTGDIAAATAIAPDLPARARLLGIVPGVVPAATPAPATQPPPG